MAVMKTPTRTDGGTDDGSETENELCPGVAGNSGKSSSGDDNNCNTKDGEEEKVEEVAANTSSIGELKQHGPADPSNKASQLQPKDVVGVDGRK